MNATSPRPSTPPSQSAKPAHPAPSPAASPLAKRTKPPTAPAEAHSTSAPATSGKAAMAAADAPPVADVAQGPPFLVKLLVPTAKAPSRGSAFAAGYDMYAAAPITVPARGKALVSTGVAVAVPAGTYGRVAPRSGLAAKNFIDTGAGVIDADYRGEVKVLLFNHAETDFEVKEGDRVAQLVLERIYTPEVKVVEALEESVRGAGGFGSTG